jgi:predicted enzyme related to lactoylglutathione lyase
MTKDVAGAKKFYTEMFGWTAEDMDMGPMTYTMFKNGDDPVCGMIEITEEMGGVPPHLLSYITVEDIGAAVAKAKGLGAQICKDVTEIPMGKFAIVTDPGGVGFAFWEYNDAECEG